VPPKPPIHWYDAPRNCVTNRVTANQEVTQIWIMSGLPTIQPELKIRAQTRWRSYCLRWALIEPIDNSYTFLRPLDRIRRFRFHQH
jgi:hypothetical protein